MKRAIPLFLCLILSFVVAEYSPAMEPYMTTMEEITKVKAFLNDPSPILKESNFYRTWIPDEAWQKITFDQEAMKKGWAEVVGFKAPEVVGKIVPEIVPGKYTYRDKARLPFDKLMPKTLLDKFNPPGEGTPNHVMNFTEIEVVPTRQYFWSLPITEATKKYEGTAQQDEQGYIIQGSWKAGYPFPRPSGEHKALQIVYNYERRYFFGEDYIYFDNTVGVNRNWGRDHYGKGVSSTLRCSGRVFTEPYGFLDARAERNREIRQWRYEAQEPRDFYGNIYLGTFYYDPKKPFSLLAYVNILRRIRKLSSSDKQDQALGQDINFDDTEAFNQAITPDVFPYEYKVLEDREYLMPVLSTDGGEWVDGNSNYEWKDLRLERRPMWKVELTQLDSNYIYSKRIFFVDQETLMIIFTESYDQKGRLYRTQIYQNCFLEPMGIVSGFFACSSDHIDVHSTCTWGAGYPALWLTRKDLSLKSLIRAK